MDCQVILDHYDTPKLYLSIATTLTMRHCLSSLSDAKQLALRANLQHFETFVVIKISAVFLMTVVVFRPDISRMSGRLFQSPPQLQASAQKHASIEKQQNCVEGYPGKGGFYGLSVLHLTGFCSCFNSGV